MAWCIEVANGKKDCGNKAKSTWNKIAESKFFEKQSITKPSVVTRTNSETLYISHSHTNISPRNFEKDVTPQYRIIFRGTKLIVVAKGMSFKKTDILWNIICTEIEPMIDSLETEKIRNKPNSSPKIQRVTKNETSGISIKSPILKFFKIKDNTKSTPPKSPKKERYHHVSPETQDFLMIKISAMIKDTNLYRKNITKLNNESYFRRKFGTFENGHQIEIGK